MASLCLISNHLLSKSKLRQYIHQLFLYSEHRSIQFSDVNSAPDGSIARCVWFDLIGRINFSDVVSGNLCSTFEQGHLSIVAESNANASFSTQPGRDPNDILVLRHGGRSINSTVCTIIGSAFGGLLLLVSLGLLVPWVQRYKKEEENALGGKGFRGLGRIAPDIGGDHESPISNDDMNATDA